MGHAGDSRHPTASSFRCLNLDSGPGSSPEQALRRNDGMEMVSFTRLKPYMDGVRIIQLIVT
jgi:hypothetical protein